MTTLEKKVRSLERQVEMLTQELQTLRIGGHVEGSLNLTDHKGNPVLHVSSFAGETRFLLYSPGQAKPALELGAGPNGGWVAENPYPEAQPLLRVAEGGRQCSL